MKNNTAPAVKTSEKLNVPKFYEHLAQILSNKYEREIAFIVEKKPEKTEE